MKFLYDLAMAHRKHEGWYPKGTHPGFPRGSVSWRNNNPGNLRLTSYQKRAYKAVPGECRFAKFPTYEIGFQALMDDLRAKITGHSAHIDYSKNPTLYDLIKVYAPADDGNNPHGYTQSVVYQMRKYNIKSNTPLSELALLIAVPDSIPIKAQIRSLTRAIQTASGRRLTRLKEALRRITKLKS